MLYHRGEIRNPESKLYIVNFYYLRDPSFSNAHSITFAACSNGFIALNDPYSTGLLSPYIPVAKSYSSSHQGSSLQPQSDYTVQTTNPHPRFLLATITSLLFSLSTQQMMHGLGMGRKSNQITQLHLEKTGR